MTEPGTPSTPPPHDTELSRPAAPESIPTVAPLSRAAQTGIASPTPSLPERIFHTSGELRLGWRLALYFTLGAAIVAALGWIGESIFPNPHGAARLWEQLYTECTLVLGAFLPALLLARLEHRRFDDYGLPRRQILGRLFWIGAVWGFVSIAALLLLLHGAHALDFGGLALHGMHIVRLGAFWAVYFLAVGLFEEFLLRGYLLFTLTRWSRFWPTAIALSAAFGAIHLANRGETAIGALGAGLIGLFFCFTLRRTGNLWFAVGFHASWDWGETYFFAVPDSGTTAPGHLLSPVFHGPPWLTGGSVGPEASVLLLVVMAAVWWAFHRQYREARYFAGV